MASNQDDHKDEGSKVEVAEDKFLGILPGSVRDVVGPLLLLLICPAFVIVLWHTICHLDGSVVRLWQQLSKEGTGYFRAIWPYPVDPVAWKLISSYAAFELALMRLLPGKTFIANATATGHRPVYKANGMQAYVVTLLTFAALVATDTFDPALVYDKLGEILSALCVFSLFFVLALYFKGLHYPSTADCGTNGNPVKDYFWGTELYPRILGWDVKMFTNCRFGMMYWAVGILCYALKQRELHGYITNSMAVSVTLQLVYIGKFFWWESGYMNTMDIQHDRAGYYICWGCLVWVPSVYTSPAMYLVKHPHDLHPAVAVAIFLAGVFCIWANYDADRQRQHFRKVNGKCKIWGKPAEMIVASYTNTHGDTSQSLLLCSGWWGLARHFHYIPEILGSFFWTLPGGLPTGSDTLSVVPFQYFYVIFLTILLLDRSVRDDGRCRGKYGKDWAKYCERVRYKVVPGLL